VRQPGLLGAQQDPLDDAHVSDATETRLSHARAGKGETTMAARTRSIMSAAQARTQLDELLDERATAQRSPLAGNAAYMADLEAEIAACRATYVAAAVTELALLRGAALGRNQG
jgi:prephenate dehydratase